MARKLGEGPRPLTNAERQSRQRQRKAAQTAKLRAALDQIQTARTLREARKIAAAALSYDGINEAIKHRVKGNTRNQVTG
jgi:hypothetical protein